MEFLNEKLTTKVMSETTIFPARDLKVALVVMDSPLPEMTLVFCIPSP